MSAVAAAVVGGGAALLGAGINYIGSQNAANTEAGAANNATNAQLGMFNVQQANAQPYLQSGTQALSTLNSDMPDLTRQFTMGDFQQDPGYAFDLQQGEQAMQRSAAAKGMLNSSGTQQNLNNYAQGMASNEYQNAYSRFTNNQQQKYNMLSGMSQQGLQATGLTNAAAQNAGNNISSNIIGAGNASAAAQVGGANAITGGMSSLANTYMGNSMLSQILNKPQNMPAQGGGGGFSMAMPNTGMSSYGGPDTNMNMASLLASTG